MEHRCFNLCKCHMASRKNAYVLKTITLFHKNTSRCLRPTNVENRRRPSRRMSLWPRRAPGDSASELEPAGDGPVGHLLLVRVGLWHTCQTAHLTGSQTRRTLRLVTGAADAAVPDTSLSFAPRNGLNPAQARHTRRRRCH